MNKSNKPLFKPPGYFDGTLDDIPNEAITHKQALLLIEASLEINRVKTGSSKATMRTIWMTASVKYTRQFSKPLLKGLEANPIAIMRWATQYLKE